MSAGGIVGFAEEAAGFALANYLRLVRRLNRFVVEPAPLEQSLGAQHPAVVAMWHGQHLMIPFARAPNMTRACAMVSRHRDAGLQAIALRRLNVEPIRGSGARGDKVREKGGADISYNQARTRHGALLAAPLEWLPRLAGAVPGGQA